MTHQEYGEAFEALSRAMMIAAKTTVRMEWSELSPIEQEVFKEWVKSIIRRAFIDAHNEQML